MKYLKDLEDLSGFEKHVLLKCCELLDWSLHSRLALQYLTKKIDKSNQKYIKKVIKGLVSNGFIIEHPSGRNITYRLSREGRDAGYIIKRESENDN